MWSVCNPSDGVLGVGADLNMLIWQYIDCFDHCQRTSLVTPVLCLHPDSSVWKVDSKQCSRIFKTRGNMFKNVLSLYLNPISGFWFPWLSALFLQSYLGSRAFQKEDFCTSPGYLHVIVAGIRSCGDDIIVSLTNHCFATDVCPVILSQRNIWSEWGKMCDQLQTGSQHYTLTNTWKKN